MDISLRRALNSFIAKLPKEEVKSSSQHFLKRLENILSLSDLLDTAVLMEFWIITNYF